jgi:hypothetical protein
MMEKVKSTKEFNIFKKKSGRYGVRASNGKWINGEDKVKILADEKLIKLSPKKQVTEAPAEEAQADS